MTVRARILADKLTAARMPDVPGAEWVAAASARGAQRKPGRTSARELVPAALVRVA
ncbi:hypothetical protein FACS1894171_1200 [Clostridia bacterium]|nr:hypothetical protein FACS1894171_1200 [Clostridia bacterium]